MVGNEMATVSHLQSRMKYAIIGKLMKANVQERLSITPTSFLCSMLTHSTSGKSTKNVYTHSSFWPLQWYSDLHFKNLIVCYFRAAIIIIIIIIKTKQFKKRVILTEYRGDDDTASNGESSEESQHCKTWWRRRRKKHYTIQNPFLTYMTPAALAYAQTWAETDSRKCKCKPQKIQINIMMPLAKAINDWLSYL